MSEIERNHGDHSDLDHLDTNTKDDKVDGDTSVDSKMDDTPANYNVANQRFEHESEGVTGNHYPMVPVQRLDGFVAQSDFTDD